MSTTTTTKIKAWAALRRRSWRQKMWPTAMGDAPRGKRPGAGGGEGGGVDDDDDDEDKGLGGASAAVLAAENVANSNDRCSPEKRPGAKGGEGGGVDDDDDEK